MPGASGGLSPVLVPRAAVTDSAEHSTRRGPAAQERLAAKLEAAGAPLKAALAACRAQVLQWYHLSIGWTWLYLRPCGQVSAWPAYKIEEHRTSSFNGIYRPVQAPLPFLD